MNSQAYSNFFDQFYAKSDGVTTLRMHTQHVIKAGENLLNKLCLTEQERMYWKPKLFRCAVLHDLGKIHSDFQKSLNGDRTVSIRHEIISLWFCENFLNLPADELFAIATHHKGIEPRMDATGRLCRDILSSDMLFHYQNEKQLLRQEILEAWLALMGLNIEIKTGSIDEEISSYNQRLLHYSQQVKAIPVSQSRQRLSFMRALLIAADHIGSARMENTIPSYKKITLLNFQPNCDGTLLPFRKFQETLQTIKTDIILNAPTGSGKTEAALSWVWANQTDNARLFYLLPYTASINAMVRRLTKVFDTDKVTALHSKTLDFFYEQLSEEESNHEKDYTAIEAAARSKKSLSGELFFPVKVATLHQILKTSLKGKGWELALYDYKNALFIIDEFHTYDALLTGMLLASIKLFKRLFSARFFFMSATIPDFMLNTIIEEVFEGNNKCLMRPNPTFESDKVVLDRKRHQLYCEGNTSLEDKLSLIKDYLAEGRSVLIIANNVKTAQKLFRDIDFSGHAKLLHSGFNKRDRNEIEKTITHEDASKRPQLLIATQAVEVSLDIDYDIAFIENAPIDALIQRFGRVNRTGTKQLYPIDRESKVNSKTVPVYLFEKIIGRTPFYDKEVLKATWENLMRLNGEELSEIDLTNVCNAVYQNGYNENQQKDFENGLTHPTIINFEKDWIAGHWEDWVEELLDNSNQKIEVLCSNLIKEFDRLKKEKRYIEANQLLVQVYGYELENCTKDQNRNVMLANNLFYDNTIGYRYKENVFEDRCL
jgi:CRISPR-associated endonuclease/helicase Cas3